jgi:hypothetical protein
MRTIVPPAIAVVVLAVALVQGYRLFAPIPTTAVVAVRADRVRGDMSKSSAGTSAANSGDAPALAGRELTVGPPTNDPNFYRERWSAASLSAPLPPTSTAAAPASAARISALPPPTAVAATPPSTSPISAPPPPTAVAASDHSEAAALLAHGRASLSNGDVALARLFLRRAAERDDPQAALVLGGTYDPTELRRLDIPNFQAQADPAKAREWYRRAADLGSAAAAFRLERLP